MSPFYDGVGDSMSSMIGSDPNQNSVGNVWDSVYPSDGSVGGCTCMALYYNNKTANQQQKQANACSTSVLKSPLGSEYGTSFQWARGIQDWAQFFKGVGPGNEYTNHLVTQKPMFGKGAEAVNPEEFYNKWYDRMRHFAQAEALVDKGNQVRTR